MRIRHRAWGHLVTTAVVTALLTGCAAAQTPQSASTGGGTDRPAFQGSFAAEYQEAWDKSTTAGVKAMLRDERITDQEWSQVLKQLEMCLDESGISLDVYNTDGSYEVNARGMDGRVANERMGGCEQESGEAWIGHLYRSQTSNPQNIPATQLLTECLVRNGAVPTTYTEEEYLEDAPTLSFPFTDEHGFQIFEFCNADFAYDE